MEALQSSSYWKWGRGASSGRDDEERNGRRLALLTVPRALTFVEGQSV